MNLLHNYISENDVYDPIEVYEILVSMTREQTITFLVWNDDNGTYRDEDCKVEGMQPLTESEAKLLAMKLLWENTL